MRHESAHRQAGDSRWIILFTLIRCTNWWNPLAHRLVTHWSDAREQQCDLCATGISETRADYGKFLVQMACQIHRQPPLTVAMAQRPHTVRLKRRIISLLGASAHSQKPVGRSFIATSSAVFLACAVLVSCMTVGATARKQVKITARLVMTPTKPIPKNGDILNNGELHRYLKSASTKKGSDLMNVPSVTSRSGQAATVEIIREVPRSVKQISARKPDAPSPLVGVFLGSNALLVEDQADLRYDVAYRFVPGVYEPIRATSTEISLKGLDPNKIKTVKKGVRAMLKIGQILCVDLGETEPGKFLQVFVEVNAIDDSDGILDSFKNSKPVAPEPKLH